MTHFVCTNCGFWQKSFARPQTCPVCLDFRHSPPQNAPFEFWSHEETAQRASTRWSEIALDVWAFASSPSFGIGPRGYVLKTSIGNIIFDLAPWLSDESLDFIASLGHLRWIAASHPHTYGALWRAQERFSSATVTIQVEDLMWTNAFNAHYPFDESLQLTPEIGLYQTGGHFAGHTILHWRERGYLFAGDMVKFHFDGDKVSGLSTHKGFNRQIPMSHAELRRYAQVVEELEFDTVFTSFDNAPCSREKVLHLFDKQLEGAPFCAPVQWEEL